MFKKILIANDGSEGAKKALKVAIDLAKKDNADLHSISVEEGVPHYAATIGEVEEFRKEANEFFKRINDDAMAMARKRRSPSEIALNRAVLSAQMVSP